MKDNRDFIASKFESENITAPESLSEENIRARLENAKGDNIVKIKKNNKRFVKPAVAIAACFVIAIGATLSVATLNKNTERVAPQSEDVQPLEGIVRFSDYDELEEFVGKLQTENDAKYISNGLKAVDGATGVYEKSTSDAAAPSHSSTYTQVADVDEADVIKTDGKYIYFLGEGSEKFVIYSVDGGKTKLASEFKLVDSDSEDVYEYYTDMYLDGDRVYLLGSQHSYSVEKDSKDGGFGTDNTVIATLDISDRTNVKKLDEFKMSGNYTTSRMVDGCIYIVSNYYAYRNIKFVPCYTDEKGSCVKVPADNICAFDCCRTPSYAVVGAFDTKSGKGNSTEVKAILGGANNVYCNTKNLYISCVDYEGKQPRTEIIKYSFDGASLKEQASGSVNGYVNNQWSFDEKDGYLRVATTTDKNGTNKNKLFVLDSNLKKVGEVDSFAKDEHIEAVRYIGDFAYVITYEQTDPLFIIDLTNPKKPEITGEVKIDGFSTNLVPVGENMLMGIGYATEEKEWGVVADGVKIVLFDISDKNKPTVLDEKVYSDYFSDAQYDHRAILQNADENYLAIPLGSYDDDGGAVVFTEQNGKIKILKKYKAGMEINRLAYIGENLFAVNIYEGDISSFTLK